MERFIFRIIVLLVVSVMPFAVDAQTNQGWRKGQKNKTEQTKPKSVSKPKPTHKAKSTTSKKEVVKVTELVIVQDREEVESPQPSQIEGNIANLIARRMEREANVMARIQGAVVDTFTDQNGITAISVVFASDYLFELSDSKLDLSYKAKGSLTQIAKSLTNLHQTMVEIYAHTDNIGTQFVNQTISKGWAYMVLDFLDKSGIETNRMWCEGLDYQFPIASNATAEGRAKNRRIEIYITADEDMINDARNGVLK